MFKYGNSSRTSTPGEKQNKQITKYREVRYVRFCKYRKQRIEVIGQEIVQELPLDPTIEFAGPIKVGTKTIDTSEKDYAEFKKKNRYFNEEE